MPPYPPSLASRRLFFVQTLGSTPRAWAEKAGASWLNPGFVQQDNEPVAWLQLFLQGSGLPRLAALIPWDTRIPTVSGCSI
jgi:hypothetical protein